MVFDSATTELTHIVAIVSIYLSQKCDEKSYHINYGFVYV